MNNSHGEGRQSATDTSLPSLIDEKTLAKSTGLSIATIRRRRLLRKPPQWIKLGSRVLYRPDDVRAWINASMVQVEGAKDE
jgi:predicted DNA-binding transcriptional regulator AlpA